MKNRKTVLITGASSGIGYELSWIFAKNGNNLVIVARNEKKLEHLANRLKEKYEIEILIIPKDLSLLSASEEIFTELQNQSIIIDILVNNAGLGIHGPFYKTDLRKELEIIQVNLIALTVLTKLLLPEMLKQGDGKILNIGSRGSFMPGPLSSIYCATKAFVLSFSEALAEELKGTGVTVTTLCPGPTKTEFFKNAKWEGAKGDLFQMNAKKVAQMGYNKLMRGKRVVIPGMYYQFERLLIRFAPSSFLTFLYKKGNEIE